MDAVALSSGRIAAPIAAAAIIAAALLLPAARAAGLAPTPEQQATARLIAQAIAAQHYRPRAPDAQLSADMYRRFLDTLDPGRDIFASEDVAGLEKYRDRMVSALRDGELDAVYAIYGVYRAKLDERLSRVRESLATPASLGSDASIPIRGPDAPRLSREALDAFWRARLRNELLTLVLAGRSQDAAVGVLRKRYEQIGARAAAIESDDVFQLFIDACTRSLDPHSEYFLPRRAQPAQGERAPLEGIGVQLRTDREFVAIRRVFDGGAADRSGQLHIGDRILAVGQGTGDELVDVVGWTLDPVVDLIRGPIGSTVRLQVSPKGADARTLPGVVTLVRDRIDLKEQSPRKTCETVSGERVCSITIPRFYIDYAGAGRGADYAGTAADVARLLNEDQDRPPDGIVLDLRGNGGGALLEAARLAGLFIDLGPIVQVKHATGDIEQFPDPIPGAIYDGPLVVLVDRSSASATEIFAAAMHDYRRAAIVGEHTYGKGTVQETVDLNESEGGAETFGQLVLTTAEYFRVTGKSTQLTGVEIDLELPPWPGAGEYGERFEPNPLPAGDVPAVKFTPLAAATLITSAARTGHSERLQRDPALRAVMAAAHTRTRPAATSLALDEATRRAELKQIMTDDETLARALRAAFAPGNGAAHADDPPEVLWRALVLLETERVLADSIRSGHADAH
jgi:carboxyl-terminal processing protease